MSAPHTKATAGSPRIGSLDGLRGLAALVVVIGHTIGAVREPPRIAAPSVMLFFVLSGYCLTSSALRGEGAIDRVQFYVRRLFRIHPPYVAALAFAWGTCLVLGTIPYPGAEQGWNLKIPQVPPTASNLLRHVSFPGTAQNMLPIGWTLQVEAIYSILLPAMVLLARRTHGVVALFLALAASHPGLVFLPGQEYAAHFMLGIVLHQGSRWAGGVVGRAPRVSSVLLLSVATYFTCITLRRVPAGWDVLARSGVTGYKSVVLLSTGIASAALILGAVHVATLRRMLEWAPIAFLGRISYSVYLLHFTILLVLGTWVREPPGDLGVLGLVLGTCALTVLCSALAFRAVERPSIRIGNRICAWMAGRAETSAHLSRIERTGGPSR